jgi:hypothetical protein
MKQNLMKENKYKKLAKNRYNRDKMQVKIVIEAIFIMRKTTTEGTM